LFLLLFSVFFIVGLIPYFVRILTLFYSRTSKFHLKKSTETQEFAAPTAFPKISVILPVYNEEKIIVRKIQNLLNLKYPKNRLEIVIVDGCSTDKTVELIKSIEDQRIVLVKNANREGVTQATKDGVQISTGDVVVLTDVEALSKDNVLLHLAADLENQSIGAVTGMEIIVNFKDNLVTQMEQTHRSYYNIFSLSESIVYSTSYFRGEFAAIRKLLFPMNIDSYRGILDIEIALSAIRAGYRAICDPRIKFYGLATNKLSDRNRQKIQRATLNQECILKNKDLLFTPNFYGRVIFPTKFADHIISPFLFLVSTLLFPLVLVEFPWQIDALFLIVFVGCCFVTKVRSLILTFAQSQVYLLIGLLKATIFGHPKFSNQVETTRRNFDIISD
jgi:glycosyltransferase involved in cell wall biosynthesis